MPNGLHEDIVRRQVDKVLSSNTFRTSGSLRRLLEYLVECTLAGDAHGLKEYRIGVEGLGKEESYDPRTDPSVRVQVGRLRSRLAEYYLDEGRNDPVLITVPKGAFSVVFEDRVPSPPPPVPEPLPAPPAPSERALRWPVIVLTGILCLIALWAFAARFGTKHPVAEENPAFEELWKPYFSSPKPTLIALGVPLSLRVQTTTPEGVDLIAHVRDGQINQWPSSADSQEAKRLEVWKKQLRTQNLSPSYHYLAVGEAIGAILLGNALSRHNNLTIVRSHMLSWDAANGANVIFIGAPKFNPHLRNALVSSNFRIGDFQIHNLRPKPGEKKAYPDVARVTDLVGAAMIARYHSPGGGSWFTLVGSANSMCTWAAIEYLTRPEYVTRLVASLRQAFGKIPNSFEAVVEARFDQSSPVEVRHVALRELEN
ncbi:MAG: hypothetical protein IRZ15_07035 [Bryobacteraceae bacterium]|nr:hypothetical protein [Bryobacteraceae bacterium]